MGMEQNKNTAPTPELQSQPPLQPSQEEMYLAGTPVAPAVPDANLPKTKKSKAPIIILITIIVLIAAGILAFVLISNNGQGGKADDSGKVADDGSEKKPEEKNVGSDVKFEDLTKDQALAYYSRMFEEPFVIPDGYVKKEIIDAYKILEGRFHERDLRLVYSYDSLDELKQVALDRYNRYSYSKSPAVSEGDLVIKEYDYYAIVSLKDVEEFDSCDDTKYSDCDELLSFKKKYLDYEQVVSKEGSGPTYVNDVKKMVTRDADVVNYLMRVNTFFYSNGWNVGPGTIYSYSFEETDDEYLLTLDLIGVGYNMTPSFVPTGADDMYAINLYRRCFVVLKEDGYMGVKKYDKENETEIVRSIPLTKKELEVLENY